MTHWILFLIALLSLVTFRTHSAITTTLVPQKSPYFQCGIVQLVQTQASLLTYSAQVTYMKAKTQPPVILISINSVEYDLNTLSNGFYELYASTGIQSPITTTGFKIICYTRSLIKIIKQSYLVIDKKFPYLNAFAMASTLAPRVNLQLTLTHEPDNPTFGIFITGLYYVVEPSTTSSRQKFGFDWQVTSLSSSTTKFDLKSDINNFKFNKTGIIIFGVYQDKIPQKQFKFQFFELDVQNDYKDTYFSSIFSQGNTAYLAGLRNFYLNAVRDSQSPSFSFNIDHQFTGHFILTNPTSFTNLQTSFFVITHYECPSTHPFKKNNTDLSAYQCHDLCNSSQFETFDDFHQIYQCKPCQNHCFTCSSATICNSCDYFMELTQTFTCELKDTYANVSNTIQLCSYHIPGCEKCPSDATACTQCKSGFFLSSDGTECNNCSQNFDQCKSCNSTHCRQCNTGYILVTATMCLENGEPFPYPPKPKPSKFQCDKSCLKCNSSNPKQCLRCIEQQLVLQNGVCKAKCGDGKLLVSEQCDDGNFESYDGCSPDCKIEPSFICSSKLVESSLSRYLTSTCKYNKTIQFQIKRMVKQPYENSLKIYIDLPPILASAWSAINLTKIFNFSGSAINSINSIKVYFDHIFLPNVISKRLLQSSIYDPSQYHSIVIDLRYFSSIEDSTLKININPINSNVFTFSTVGSFQSEISLSSNNNVMAHYYEQSYYQLSKILYTFSLILGVLCFGIILVGTIVGNLMIGLQVSFVCQMSYFSLLNVGQLNPMFYALSGLKYSSGFNLPVSSSQPIYEQHNHNNFIGMGMFSSMLDNVNLSLVLVILCYLIGGILKALCRYVIKKEDLKLKMNKIGNDLLGSVGFYLVECFLMLIIVSIAINFINKVTQPLSYVIIAICAIAVILPLVFFIKFGQSQYFYRLVQKIKQAKMLYSVSLFSLRGLLAIFIVCLSDTIAGCIVVFVLFTLWAVLVIKKYQPYTRANKLRLNATLVLCFLIQVLYVYQRLSTLSNTQANMNLYIPISIISLLFIVLMINLAYFIYSIKQLRCCVLQLQWQKVKRQKLYKKKGGKIGELEIDKLGLSKQESKGLLVERNVYGNERNRFYSNKQMQNQQYNNPKYMSERVNDSQKKYHQISYRSNKQSSFDNKSDKMTGLFSSSSNNTGQSNKVTNYPVSIQMRRTQFLNSLHQNALLQKSYQNQETSLQAKNQHQIINQDQSIGSNHEQIRKQIRKQLKNSQMPDKHKAPSNFPKGKKNQKPNQQQKQFDLYAKLKENYYRQRQAMNLDENGERKYVYTNQNVYCVYDQFNRI